MKHQTDAFLIEDLQLRLLNAGNCKVGQEWNYSHLTSPFTRLFYIKSGQGYILPNNQMHQLKPGYLYLIPSYTLCSYHCVDEMEQYYIHFTNESSEGFKIFDFLSFTHEIKATDFDAAIFERLLALNTDKALRQSDPSIYEKKFWSLSQHQTVDGKTYLETGGLIRQLLSRFIVDSKVESKNLQHISGLRKVFKHINSHISEELKVDELAKIACYSSDHFSRLFQKTTGVKPMQYINQKRIEKAQILLLTTSLTQQDISDECGFNNLTYYYRIFKKMVGSTPVKYRQMGGLI